MAENLFASTMAMMAVSGAACGLTGVFVFLLNIPFVGVAIAHAAMAGGIWGAVFNLPAKLSAFFGAFAAAALAGPASERSGLNANISLSIIFSVSLGLAFLGMAYLPAGSADASRFLWGSVLLAGAQDLYVCAAMLAVLAGFVTVFYRQVTAVLFNREVAASIGINDRLFYIIILMLTGAVVAVTLDIIGGLMLFSLIILPPAAAWQLTFDMKRFFIYSTVIGTAGACTGTAVSFMLDWPVSASVVLALAAVFLACMMAGKKHGGSAR
ncbi:MAG: metal ABC transporter permease [Spirochaetia bacterium]|nr:metal ABC transporter permease [Spirochaetia bacterium]